MEEIGAAKIQIREDISQMTSALSENQIAEKTRAIEARLFEFANFLEAKIALLYVNGDYEVQTEKIIKRSYDYNKIVVLPAFDPEKFEMNLMKVDRFAKELVPGPRKVLEPDANRCKTVPMERIDIAIIPGLAFDEKGGRIGSGRGYYDRLIPKLAITTRKVALTFEEQIVPQIPMESHDKHVDIIITDQRIIYKI
ncbi:5-formyltetrahydrofolate cyclo-ligase (EC [Olavius sp. associated proteobacterium Delta 1]|nr:5-formyltetrahydrofolate cyclo-ligase (EC [Olavius sp. associated proteobacterium Delta 1]